MAFELTPGVQVERGADGRVRSLNHVTEPYRPGVRTFNARALAQEYLRDVAGLYGISSDWLGAVDSMPAEAVESAGTEIRFGQQDAVTGTATVSYQQTHFGLPVWQAGFTVSMLAEPLRATGSLSTLLEAIDVRKPSSDAKCMGDAITLESLSRALNVARRRAKLAITAQRLWVFRYVEAERTEVGPAPSPRGGGFIDVNLPALPLPPVDRSIVAGRQYVVTEVLFDLPLPDFPPLHWRAFIEVNTCSVLYLRCLLEMCTGSVYLTDPITATGDTTITACSPATTLDPLRSDVTLEGLTAATPQGLTGEYVTVQQGSGSNAPPTVTPPPCDFTYSVPTPSFAAVCAYYHVDELFRLVESFGYTPITTFFQNTAFPFPVYFLDLPIVNSYANPNSAGNGFGSIDCGFEQDGCPVGIATDWRVTMHEFVHGMLDDRIHSGLLGFAHNGGDGFGAIFMDPGSQAPDRFLTFPWVPDVPRRHDRDVASGWAWGGTNDDSNYQSEEILSTTLFRIYRSTGGDSPYLSEQQLGSKYVLMTMTRAMASLPLASTTPTTAVSYAQALINADAGLTAPYQGIVTGGAIGKVVRWSFEKQGLYQPAGAPTPVTTPGAPPAVDVYVTDANGGEYQYQEVFWENTNIWNLLAPDPTTTPADHQTPIVGQTNYAYVTVSNRGTQAAGSVVVSAYHCRPSAGLLWPDDWQPMTTASIAVPGAIAPGATVLVGPFEWTPSEIGHECMLMSVSASGDVSNADPASGLPCAAGPTTESRMVPFDNNLGQRNVAPVAGGGGLTGLGESFNPRRFWVNNPYEFRGLVELKATMPDFLAERGWKAEFVNAGGSSFTLSARGSREVQLRLKPGGQFSAADVRKAGVADIVVRTTVNGIPNGGMTYAIDPDLKAPPPERPGKHRPGRCDTEAEELLKCLHLPERGVKAVRVKRITLDIDLEADDD